MRKNLPIGRALAAAAFALVLACLPAAAIAQPGLAPATTHETRRVAEIAQPGKQAPATSPIQAFHLFSANDGWLLAGGRLYRTADGGDTWSGITPPDLAPARLRAAWFTDPRHGWLAQVGSDSSGAPAYTVSRTTDGGATWDTHLLPLFRAGDPASLPAALYLDFVDETTGSLVVAQATSANFSAGTLFRTEDGGQTWTRLNMPVGEPVTFVDGQTGWTAGGAAGDRLYRTQDGGRTWQGQEVGTAGATRSYNLPQFRNEREGALAVAVQDAAGARVELYATDDAGQAWQRAGTLPAGTEVPSKAHVALAAVERGRWLVRAPGTRRLVRVAAGDGQADVAQDALAGGIVDLDMATPAVGWARHAAGTCPAPGQGCTAEEKLLRTVDGGRTWKSLSLPAAAGDMKLAVPGLTPPGRPGLGLETPQAPLSPNAGTMTGQGFDACEVPTAGQLQNWFANSPYRAVNLYTGGSMRACANSGMNASFLASLAGQGWRFIPTWVGPQSACWGWGGDVISNDPGIARQQGIAQADLAATNAAGLGLAGANGSSGAPIYYDLEAYDTTNATCRDAARAFVSGWSGQLRARGYLAGVYGATCASALSDFVAIDGVPDAVWAALWSYDGYDGGASVWGLACLSDTLWTTSQRLRQYTGGHDETWGGLTLNIDSNVLDGPVAGVATPPEAPHNPSPPVGAVLERTDKVVLAWQTNVTSCTTHIWGGSIDETHTNNCSPLDLGTQLGGSYRWQVTAANSSGSTRGPVWSFAVKPAPPANAKAALVSPTRIDLSWTLSADDAQGIDGYQIKDGATVLANLPRGTTSYQVTDLPCGTAHAFAVISVRQGVGSNPAAVGATTAACVLSAPANFRITETSKHQVALAWDAVSGAAGYRLYRWNGARFALAQTLPAGTTSFVDADLKCLGDYRYQVAAYTDAGESQRAGPVRTMTVACAVRWLPLVIGNGTW